MLGGVTRQDHGHSSIINQALLMGFYSSNGLRSFALHLSCGGLKRSTHHARESLKLELQLCAGTNPKISTNRDDHRSRIPDNVLETTSVDT